MSSNSREQEWKTLKASRGRKGVSELFHRKGMISVY